MAQQQKLIVLSTFNLISIYFNYRSYFGAATDLEQMCQGISLASKCLFEFMLIVLSDFPSYRSVIGGFCADKAWSFGGCR